MVPILSVVIPTYNELSTLPVLLSRVLAVPSVQEVLVVDDGSTDRTDDYLKSLMDNRVSVIRHDSNRGKGTAIRAALPHVRGQYVIIQDADLEYNPQEYNAMLDAVRESEGVVYGSRTGCMVFGLLMKPQGTSFLERACFETSIFNVRASSSAQKLPPSWVGEEFTLRKFPLPMFPDRLHKGRKSASKTASLPSGPLFAIGSPPKRRTIVS